MDNVNFEDLVKNIVILGECEWVEFKKNYANPKDIGEYISALSNSACICNQQFGYLIFGIDNDTHEIVGTNFRPENEKQCNGTQDLEFWLSLKLNPRIDFEVIQGKIAENHIVIFKINKAQYKPTLFDGDGWARVSSHKKKLSDYPEKERKIWQITNNESFENLIALSSVDADKVLGLIDYPGYFKLMAQNLPDNKEGIINKLCEEKLITRNGINYNITNLGAILFASNLLDFERLSKKTIRVIVYKGKNKLETVKEYPLSKGYALEFENILNYIIESLPTSEVIESATRKTETLYPPLAIRELLANVIIHQDFFEKGTSPMIEIYGDDRIEFINPGSPLVEILRFIDCVPVSRNEKLATFMRRIKFCEERGTGIDKVVFSVEEHQLPAPEFIVDNNFTKVVLFAPRYFKRMNREDKIRACYQHCCLKYVSGEVMSNESLRKRLNISDKNYPTVSLIIKDTIEKKLIKSEKNAKYVPFWA